MSFVAKRPKQRELPQKAKKPPTGEAVVVVVAAAVVVVAARAVGATAVVPAERVGGKARPW